mgnify:FL=1
MNNIINIYDLNIGTIIIDLSTIFLLVEMAIHTSIFRRRSWLSDQLFFVLIILDIIIASADAFNYSLEYSSLRFAGIAIILGDTVFSLAFEAFCLIYTLYLMCLAGKEVVVRFKWRRYATPMAVEGVVIIGNIFGKYLFYVDDTVTYHFGPLYYVILLPLFFLIPICIIQIIKMNKKYLIIFLGVIFARILLGIMIRGISSTSFLFAIGLSYSHVCVMNKNFNLEVGQ